jgi:CTP:molybdopterin cytidylyltransferase MocA
MVLAHVQALGTRCAPVLVVTGAHHDTLMAALGDAAITVHNPDWQTTGPIDSLRCALKAVQSARVVVTPVDTPPVLPGDLQRLLDHPAPAALCHGGQPGHPICLDAALIQRICAAEPLPEGLRSLGVLPLVEASTPEVLISWNTPKSWEEWLQSAGPARVCYAAMGPGLERRT